MRREALLKQHGNTLSITYAVAEVLLIPAEGCGEEGFGKAFSGEACGIDKWVMGSFLEPDKDFVLYRNKDGVLVRSDAR